jgi:hypothetical protein
MRSTGSGCGSAYCPGFGRKKARKRFFFEKKKQKTSINRGQLHARPPQTPHQIKKSFLLLFFKKEALAYFLTYKKNAAHAAFSHLNGAG